MLYFSYCHFHFIPNISNAFCRYSFQFHYWVSFIRYTNLAKEGLLEFIPVTKSIMNIRNNNRAINDLGGLPMVDLSTEVSFPILIILVRSGALSKANTGAPNYMGTPIKNQNPRSKIYVFSLKYFKFILWFYLWEWQLHEGNPRSAGRLFQ